MPYDIDLPKLLMLIALTAEVASIVLEIMSK